MGASPPPRVPVTVVAALWRLLFEATSSQLEYDMWKRRDPDFPVSRLNKLKSHLDTGWQVWMGAKSSDFNDELVVEMGEWKHGRTTKEGCALSVTPTGEGSDEVIAHVRLGKEGFLARTEEGRETLPTFHRYKLVKKSDTEIQVLSVDSAFGYSMLNDMARVIRGASCLGAVVFLFREIAGRYAFSITCAVFAHCVAEPGYWSRRICTCA